MKISVFGIGYVGAVAAACLADDGHDVIAMDIDQVKVDCIKQGRSPIVEPELDELISKNAKEGRLTGTNNCADAVANSDISLICVPTPSNDDGSLRLDFVRTVCRQIGAEIAKKNSFHVVVLRSTVVPGTAMNVAIPELEKASGKKAGVDFGFGNNPEFLRESTAVYDYYNPPMIVIGASDQKTGQMISDLYKGIEAQEVITDVGVAEGVKYACNAWHAAKVGFANELGNIFAEYGIDSHRVMDIFCLDTKLNISKAYLKPGFAFGGSCLPKDVRAITAAGKAANVKTPIFDALMESNEEQVNRAYNMIEKSGMKSVGLFGLAFKAGSDDLRESPMVTLADRLIKNGYALKIYDQDVMKAKNMHGANRKYIEEGIPHISACLVNDPQELINDGGVFVVGNKGKDFADLLAAANENTPIIDLVRLNAPVEERKSYTGICW